MKEPGIYIVEDEAIVALDIEDGLKRQGYRVVGRSATGEAAIEELNRTTADLILMDIRLKGRMDGIETAKQLKKHKAIPIIYLTAYSEDSILQRAKDTEPHGYLLKPFEDRHLRTTIEMALHRHQKELMREKVFRDVGQSLDAFNLLYEIHTICSHCKKLRDSQGRWVDMDKYFCHECGLDFSHGYCPDCVKIYFPGLFDDCDPEDDSPPPGYSMRS